MAGSVFICGERLSFKNEPLKVHAIARYAACYPFTYLFIHSFVRSFIHNLSNQNGSSPRSYHFQFALTARKAAISPALTSFAAKTGAAPHSASTAATVLCRTAPPPLSPHLCHHHHYHLRFPSGNLHIDPDKAPQASEQQIPDHPSLVVDS